MVLIVVQHYWFEEKQIKQIKTRVPGKLYTVEIMKWTNCVTVNGERKFRKNSFGRKYGVLRPSIVLETRED